MNHNGLIILERYRVGKKDILSTILTQEPIDNVLHLDSYRGMEGIPYLNEQDFCDISRGLVSMKYLNKIKDLYLQIESVDVDLLFLTTNLENSVLPFSKANHFEFIGYDYGIYDGENCIYSVLFHEIIFGKVKELCQFYDKLNNFLLFNNLSDINLLLKIRDKYTTDSQPQVETLFDEDYPSVYSIYRYYRR